MYDVSGATGAVYTNADRTEFSVTINDILLEARAIPGLLLFEALLANSIPIADYVPPPPPVPDISRRQFFQQLAVAGIITQPDAIAALATGTVPPVLAALVAQLPSDQQFAAKMFLIGATAIQRQHPMSLGIGAAYGMTSDQIDAFFISANAL